MRLFLIAVTVLVLTGITAFDAIAESSLGSGLVTRNASAQCIQSPLDDGRCLPCPHLPHTECTM